MDIGSSVRTPSLPSSVEVPRVPTVNAAGSVRTELPAEATVQQPRPDERTNADPQRQTPPAPVAYPPPDTIDRSLTIDPTTREVVFRAVDTQSGDVVRQVPDQALLRLHVYAREAQRPEGREADHRRVERLA